MEKKQKPYLTIIPYLLVGIVMSVMGIFIYTQSSAKLSHSNSFVPTFTLQAGGETVTEKNLAGQPYAVAFGFSRCPDPTICPTILARMSQWEKTLGNKMRFVFITVDPEQDTPKVLSDYVGAFSKRIMPLSGSVAQVQAALDSYNVYAQKIPLTIAPDHGQHGKGHGKEATTPPNYTMDHHTPIFLFDGKGRFSRFIYLDDDEATAKTKLSALLT